MTPQMRTILLVSAAVLLGGLAERSGAQDPNGADANTVGSPVTVDVKLPESPQADESLQEMIRRLNAASAGAGLGDAAKPIRPGTTSSDDATPPSRSTDVPKASDPDKTSSTSTGADANSSPSELLNQINKTRPTERGSESKPVKAPSNQRKTIDLETLPEDTVKNPILLADVLYLGGHWKAASTFYVMVVESEKKTHSQSDRAWALYQLANCQRRFDPSQAKTTYKRVVEEYSTSPWVAASQVQQRLLTWKLSSKPGQLVKKHRETGMSEVNRSEDAEGRTP